MNSALPAGPSQNRSHLHSRYAPPDKKDIIYRCNAADIKMIVCVAEEDVIRHVEEAEPESDA